MFKREEFIKPLRSVEQQIADYIEPILAAQDRELILIKLSGNQRNPQLTLFINEPSLDQLSGLSRLISDSLDVANAEYAWFPGSYQLQLSSPGLERPLTKKSHFQQVIGQRIQIKTTALGTLREELEAVTPIGLQLKNQPLLIEWQDVLRANLIPVFFPSRR